MQTVKAVNKVHTIIFSLLLAIITSSCKPLAIEVIKEKIVVVTRIATQTLTPTPTITLTHPLLQIRQLL
jgi:hypothetical protein